MNALQHQQMEAAARLQASQQEAAQAQSQLCEVLAVLEQRESDPELADARQALEKVSWEWERLVTARRLGCLGWPAICFCACWNIRPQNLSSRR